MIDEAFDSATPAGSRRGARSDTSVSPLDRLPPHSIEAEQGTIACMLQVDNEAAVNEAEERNVTAEWFYDLRHQLIWEAIIGLRNAGTPIDVLTLQQWLKDRDQLEQVGGLDYLARMPELIPSAANAPHYLGILREQMLLRQVIRAGLDAVQSAYSIERGEKTSPDELVTRLERSIGRLAEQTTPVAEMRIGQIVASLMPDIEDYHRGRAQIRGLTTGLEYFDKLTCGLGGRNGNFVVISGRPSTGKTSIALQIALHANLGYVWWDPILQPRQGGGPPVPVEDEKGNPTYRRQVGIPVGIFSYEMAAPALVERMLFCRAQVDMQRWRTGFAEQYGVAQIMAASHELATAKIFIDDNPGPVESLRARARRMVRQYGIKCFVVDYFQLMFCTGRRGYQVDRVQELTEVSRQLRELGKELGIPFIVLAQMNRDYEKDTARPPRLSDLKDCGAIEQDADVVSFLYRPKLNANDKAQYDAGMESVAEYSRDWSKRPERVNLLVAKNRYGPTGKAELLFQKSCTRFHDWIAWLKDHGQKDLAEGEHRKQVSEGSQQAQAEPAPTGRDPDDGEF